MVKSNLRKPNHHDSTVTKTTYTIMPVHFTPRPCHKYIHALISATNAIKRDTSPLRKTPRATVLQFKLTPQSSAIKWHKLFKRWIILCYSSNDYFSISAPYSIESEWVKTISIASWNAFWSDADQTVPGTSVETTPFLDIDLECGWLHPERGAIFPGGLTHDLSEDPGK